MVTLRVAIIGAGPAGCTLAVLLQEKPSIHVTIFEAEASADARGQGGTLDLHTATGLAAIKRAGLYEEFQRKARYDGEAMVLADKTLRRYISVGGTTKETSRGRPEIDREDLRHMLLSKIHDGTIKWGHKVRSISDDNTIYFDTHAESGFDLVVGADGGWSKVRPLLSTVTPSYSGIGSVRLQISNAKTTAPEVYALVNHGSFFTASDGKMITAQELSDGSIQVGFHATQPESWIKDAEFDTNDVAAVKRHLLALHADWAPVYRTMITAADDDQPWIRNLYHLPVGHRWPSKGSMTLIGDAAHIFTPFAGEGVNLAMSDSMRLADAILATANESKSTLSRNIKIFEEEMFVRAAKSAGITFKLMSCMFFTEGAPDSVVEEYICAAMSDDVPWWLMPLARAAVYAYWWYWRRFGGAAPTVSTVVPVDLKQD